MAESSALNPGDPFQHEVSVEFIKQELQQCVTCVTDSVVSYEIHKTDTAILRVPIHTYICKLTNVNLDHCHGCSQYICETCLNLVNEIEQAELEYVKLKHNFELIISKNPMFSSAEKLPLENVEEMPPRDELQEKNFKTENFNVGEKTTTYYKTIVKLEPLSDEDQSEVSPKTDRPDTQLIRTMVAAKPKAKDGTSPRKQKAVRKQAKGKSSSEKQQNSNEKQQNPSEKYQCAICLRQFSQKGNYNRHMTTHSGIMPFECTTCQRRFNRKDHLLAHIRTHTGEKPFECNFCPVKFNQKGGIIKHLRTHTGQEPYQCEICHRRFKQRPHLNSHLKTHTGEKPYECNICKRRFIESSKLKIHIRTHTGERPYKCTFCDSQFNQSGNLQSHLRIHTGEKPYECVICQRKFSLKHHLRDHLSVHTGDKAYECSVCKQRFVYKHMMQRHMRKMHPAVYPRYENSICSESNIEPEIILEVNEVAEQAKIEEPSEVRIKPEPTD